MRKRFTQRASALLITLGMLALLSGLLVGLSFSARFEKSSAESYLRGSQARWLAQSATEMARARIAAFTLPPAGPYLSRPGKIVVPGAEEAGPAEVELHTQAPGGDPVNINRANALSRHPVDPSGAAMDLTWVYVRRDGETVAGPAPAYDPDNPVVGRYAWWVDDASARLNLNTAWTRAGSNAAPSNAASRIELTAIPGVAAEEAGRIAAERQKSWFVAPAEAARADGSLAGPLGEAAFSLASYSHASSLNGFGQPKIVLTTRPERAYGQPYLDTTKLPQTVDLIASYLERADWPVAPGSSFVQKYYPGHPERAPQLALNIIDYVRSKESGSAVLAPSRLTIEGQEFLGLSRTPLITEIGAWLGEPTVATDPAKNSTTTSWPLKIVVEVHLPKEYGLASISLAGSNPRLRLWASAKPDVGSYTSVNDSVITPADCSPGPVLPAGGYVVITKTAEPPIATSTASRPTRVSMKVALTNGVSFDTRLQLCPLMYTGDLGMVSNPTLLSCPLDPPGTPIADITTLEVDDPRTNQKLTDWVAGPAGSNTLGEKNSINKAGQAPGSVLPPQDTDESGLLTDAALAMPPPDAAGRVGSVAELGFVATGVEGGMTAPSVPWRSLRLQKSPQGPDVLPDWALLDLFMAPLPDNPSLPERPHPSTAGGRININALAEPFDSLQRALPLQALFSGIQPWSVTAGSPTPAQAVENVYAYLATAGWGLPHIFDLPGEILEVPGLGDEGEAAEKRAAGFLDHAVTNSNVFLIYALAQSVTQNPDGRITPTSECLTETTLERIPDPAAGTTRFRTLAFRNLEP